MPRPISPQAVHDMTLDMLRENWLEVRCQACERAESIFIGGLFIRKHHQFRRLGDLLPRLACRRCGSRESVTADLCEDAPDKDGWRMRLWPSSKA